MEHLSTVGVLDRRGFPALRRVLSLPFKQLVDVGTFIAQAGLERELPAKPEMLFHCASVSLSGGPVPCIEANCRLNQARELARYAIMLSDRVYTYNPFSQFLPTPKGGIKVEESVNFRTEFWTGLRVLMEWAPLIQEGLIFPFPHGDHYCHWCLAKSSFGADAGRRLDRAVATYKRRF